MKKLMTKCFAALLLAGMFGAAQAEIVVVSGPNGDALDKDQLANLYLGKTFNRKLIDLPEGNALRTDFYKKAVDREPAQVKAVWARVVFTGKGQAPLMLPDADMIKKAVATDPKAIGYIDKSQVDGTVKVLMTLN
jgi:ABC-type phosphate transport system substrate-binding protein